MMMDLLCTIYDVADWMWWIGQLGRIELAFNRSMIIIQLTDPLNLLYFSSLAVCRQEELKCDDQCFHQSVICDGVADCLDGRDEIDCQLPGNNRFFPFEICKLVRLSISWCHRCWKKALTKKRIPIGMRKRSLSNGQGVSCVDERHLILAVLASCSSFHSLTLQGHPNAGPAGCQWLGQRWWLDYRLPQVQLAMEWKTNRIFLLTNIRVV